MSKEKPLEYQDGKPKAYGIIDPQCLIIGYVGQTTRDLRVRLTEHISETKQGRGSRKKHAWLEDILQAGQEPQMMMLPWLPHLGIEDINDLERFWIMTIRNWYAFKYAGRGVELTNEAEGGPGQHGTSKSEEERAQISASLKAYHAERRASSTTTDLIPEPEDED
jgi:hypothetical protein